MKLLINDSQALALQSKSSTSSARNETKLKRGTTQKYMQAVLLAAGQSTRFYPFRSFPHKSAATLLGKPIFLHTLESVKKAGIADVVVITGPKNFVKEAVGDGSELGLSITYIVQETPNGMGDALLQAKDVLKDSFFVLHAHHVAFHEVATEMLDMHKPDGDAILLAREEENVQEFGVLKLKDNAVIDIVEKPLPGHEPSHLRLIGIYLLHKDFLKALSAEKPDHYNFEKALGAYAASHHVGYVATEKSIPSLKYPWDLLAINSYLLNTTDAQTSESANISEKAVIMGHVIIADDVKIMEGAVIKGPCYIGKGTTIGTNAIVRDSVTLGEHCLIGAHMEIKNSIVFDHTTTHSGFIGDSIIGSHNKIAAFIGTANVRLDRKPVRVEGVRGEVNSGLRDLGVIMGDNTKIGIRVTTMPGVVIGNNVLVGPSTAVLRNIPDNTTYYTKFREVVESRDGVKKPADKTFTASKKLVLFDIDYTLFDTDIFKESQLTTYQIYEEVLDVLMNVGKTARLGIFSEGELDFQKTKLLKTDILRHFMEENIHIVASKDETIKEILTQYKDETVVLIDDKLPVLHAAHQIMPSMYTIWVKRGIYAEKQQPISGFTPTREVTTLSEIPEIVESIDA